MVGGLPKVIARDEVPKQSGKKCSSDPPKEKRNLMQSSLVCIAMSIRLVSWGVDLTALTGENFLHITLYFILWHGFRINQN